MIIDKRTELCSATALSTAATGLATIGSLIDLQVARNIAAGRPIYIVIQINVQPTSGGAATLGFVLASDAQDPIAVDGTATEHFRTQLIPKATLVVGYSFTLPLPLENPAYEQYLGILQNVGVAALTAGKVNVFLTLTPFAWKANKSETGGY